MSLVRVLCRVAASALFVGLCACQGDDNTLPLPPDAGAADAHVDASAPHGDASPGDPNDASGGGTGDADAPDANEDGGAGETDS